MYPSPGSRFSPSIAKRRSPRRGGHLIELGWARALPESTTRAPLAASARLARLAEGERVTRGNSQITAITDDLLASGVPVEDAWREFVRDACTLSPQPASPVPDFYPRSHAARHQSFTITRFERLRVLTTELKPLVAKENPVCVRLAQRAALSGERLARLLGWLR